MMSTFAKNELSGIISKLKKNLLGKEKKRLIKLDPNNELLLSEPSITQANREQLISAIKGIIQIKKGGKTEIKANEKSHFTREELKIIADLLGVAGNISTLRLGTIRWEILKTLKY